MRRIQGLCLLPQLPGICRGYPCAAWGCAYTAKAAFLIRGQTLHKLFHLPIKNNRRPFLPLNGESLKDLQNIFQNVTTVIINEFPMVSQTMLGWIDCRLRQAKGISAPFGGVSVLLVGDPAQLPPVGGCSLHEPPSNKPYSMEVFAAYLGFTRAINLTEVRRQLIIPGDKDQMRFVDLLNKLRKGLFSMIESPSNTNY